MRTIAVIQARMGSTRFPGKILKEVSGRPLLEYMTERVARAKTITQSVIATTAAPQDRPIVDFCKRHNLPFFTGNEEDVLNRYCEAAKTFRADTVVRLTSDCPLIDPTIIDYMVRFYHDHSKEFDFVANTVPLPCLYPDGMDVEVFPFSLLEQTDREAILPSHREHVTFFMWQTGLFRTHRIDSDRSYSEYRFTVDYPQDFDVIYALIKALYPINPAFPMSAMIDYLDTHPKIKQLQAGIERNAGWKRAFDKDRLYLESRSKNLLPESCLMPIPNSLQLQKRARSRIPGTTQLLSKAPFRFAPGLWPGYFSKAAGAHVWDCDDNCYLDMSIAGIGANVLGYCDRDVDEAVIKAVRDGNSSSLNCPEELDLADLLCQLHPWAEMVRYARGGGEAMAIAVRIARTFTGKGKIAFCGYHGWHDWYLSANLGDHSALDGHLIPGLNPAGVPRALKGTALPFPYNNRAELEKLLDQHRGEFAAIVMEPQRDIDPEPGFLQHVRELADRHHCLLIFDEITIAFRLNCGGIHLQHQVNPDIAVFAKAMSNGYPMAAVIGRRNVMSAATQTFISSTYWTDRIGPTAAIATIRKFQQHAVHLHLDAIGQSIRRGLLNAAQEHGLNIEVSGITPLLHLHFLHTPHNQILTTLFTQEMLKHHILASERCYVMYSHNQENVRQFITAADAVFAKLAEGLTSDALPQMLQCDISRPGFNRLN